MCKKAKTLTRLLAAATLTLACAGAHAQAYPAKPIRFLVPFAPGGGLDLLSRALADPMGKGLGQPVVVENRASGAGIIAAETLARAPADGHTIMIGGSSLSIGTLLYRKLSFDPDKDFDSIAYLGDSYVQLWVSSALPASNLKEFVAYAKANPDKISFGSGGIGHAFHLVMEMFKDVTGTRMVHIPYKGMAAPIQDLFAGRLQAVWYVPSPPLLKQRASGKVRALVTAGEKRVAPLPDVPTMAEAGYPGFKGGATNFSLMGPAGMPKPVVDRLYAEVAKGMSAPPVVKAFDTLMITRNPQPGDHAERIWKDERQTWAPIVKALNIYQD